MLTQEKWKKNRGWGCFAVLRGVVVSEEGHGRQFMP